MTMPAKRFDEKEWEEIRKFSRVMRENGLGGIDMTIEATSLAELFDELDALKVENEALRSVKPRMRITP